MSEFHHGGTLRLRREPGFALYLERWPWMLHVAIRRFDPPYGDGRTWTRTFTLRVPRYGYLMHRGGWR